MKLERNSVFLALTLLGTVTSRAVFFTVNSDDQSIILVIEEEDSRIISSQRSGAVKTHFYGEKLECKGNYLSVENEMLALSKTPKNYLTTILDKDDRFPHLEAKGDGVFYVCEDRLIHLKDGCPGAQEVKIFYYEW
ncbi:hypothetical protein METBIDRAFT_205582 [Metschnikowia bicuspidata var. bicuspidata NRRL YB-4993]|uniref:Uncharacterized protein n=1 Tax=Metschnikowia bicuspidata var. bicuspidata NRRL YB-4993 TaxID=869754 RepID=A0A1A0HA52_9ASCO|nr:hypothetical protein METBIDRAFT_205582 [Metschnikowia bicuspidata var. bicuspidata NRRL YB-4993]OBA20753.1 hypothetical protein METBIDRAFT_205582 [Metschnikowia bicuspidata var. bicuspidata NRRL YB-4993]